MLMQTHVDFADIAPEATLSHLGKQARRAGTLVDLGFVLVHETQHLLPYRQAALWLKGEGIAALSGGLGSQQGSCAQWLKRWCESHPVEGQPMIWDLRHAARGDEKWRECLSPWSPWLMAVPLHQPDAPSGEALGVLLLARETACSQAEWLLLKQWTDVWTSCYQARRSRQRAWEWPHLQAGIRQWSWGAPAAVLTAVLGLLGLYAGQQLVPVREESVPPELAIIAPALDGAPQKARVLPDPEVELGGRLSQAVPAPLKDKPAKWVVSAR